MKYIKYYFVKFDKENRQKEYIPMSQEKYDDLKAYEPTKFTLDIDTYNRIKKEEFDKDLKIDYQVSLETVIVDNSDKNYVKNIKEIEMRKDFIKWIG